MNARTTLRSACAAAALLVAAAAPARLHAQAQPPAAAQEAKDLPLTAEQRLVYVGHYEATRPDGRKMGLRVFEENGALRGLPDDKDGSESKRLVYQGDNVFYPEGVPYFVMTFTVADGKATKFSFTREGRTFDALRTADAPAAHP